MTTTQDIDLNDSLQTEFHVVAWLFTGIAILTVGLRLHTRARVTNKIGVADYIIFVSLVSRSLHSSMAERANTSLEACSIVASTFVSYATYLGLGRHTEKVLEEYGEARLVKTAKMQILGYRTSWKLCTTLWKKEC